MDYEKVYKNALKKAQEGKPIGEIFPELKNSKDKIMSEAAIQLINGCGYLYAIINGLNIDKNDVIAWLEKQGEQKPTDLPNGEDYGIDGMHVAVDILTKTLGKVEGYQTDDGILEHKVAIADVKKLCEQKPAWSEEDERLQQCLIRDQEKCLEEVRNDKVGHSEIISDLKEMYHERIDWLKSLKKRIKGE